MKAICLIAVFACISITQLHATHASGAEISYKRVGKDSFMVYVDLYKDCKGIAITLGSISVDGIDGSYSNSFNLSQTSCKDVTNVCPGQCTKCLSSSCNANGNPNGVNAGCGFAYGYEQVRFSGLVDLSSVSNSICRFRLSLDINARPAIGNCCSAEDLYNFCVLERCSTNSSPMFVFTPDFVIFAGTKYCMSFLATDPDGDSLSYEMDTALLGYKSTCTYTGVYTLRYPISVKGGKSAFVLDSLTGSLCISPDQQQTGIVVVKVKEWRKDANGKYINIGCIRRDQLMVVQAAGAGGNKPPVVLSSSSSVDICVGKPYCFDISITDSNNTDSVFCNAFNIPNSATLTNKYFQKYSLKSTLCWTPDSTNISDAPYYFSFVVNDNHCPVPGKTNIVKTIYVRKGILFDSLSSSVNGCGDYTLTSWPPTNPKTTLWQFYGSDTIKKYGGSVSYRFPATGWNIFSATKSYSGGCDSMVLDSMYINTQNLLVNLPKDTSVCSGTTLTVSPTVKGGTSPYKYQWLTSNADTLDHLTFVANGSGWIKVTAKDANSCSYTDSMYITALAGVATQSQQMVYMCSNNLKTIGFSSVSGNKYIWNTGDTNSAISPTSNGSYILTITNANGCSGEDTFAVTVIPAPQTMMGNDTLLCTGNSITLVADTVASNFYQWSTGANSKSITVNQSGTYACTESNPSGCSSKDSVKVTLVQPAKINLGQNQTICKGDSLLLDAGAGFTNYSWTNGASTQQIYAKQFGFYQVTAKDSNLCNSQDDVVMSWYPQTTLTIQGSKRFCPGGSTTLTASSTYVNYLWNTGSSNQNIQVNTGGTYDLTVTDTSGCKQQIFATVTVNPAANAAFQYQLIGNGGVSFKPNDTTNNAYTWYFGDNQTGFQTSPVHIYTNPGNYTASLSVLSKNACIDSSAQLIAVNMGIADASLLQNINIIPNPAVDEALCIWQLSKTGQVMIELLDLTGKRIALLLNEKQSQGEHQLGIKGSALQLGSGVYMLRLTADGQQATVKLMWY